MSDHIIVLPDQNSDLPGHMSFQKKKKIAALYLSDAIFSLMQFMSGLGLL